jgi:hypothetical protein
LTKNLKKVKIKAVKGDRMETQKHGFTYEERKINEYGLTKYKKYTAPFDAYDDDHNYQIKTIKKGSSIDLGDYFRNAYKNEDFYLMIGFWEDDKNNIVEEYLLYIPANIWKENLSFHKKEELKYWITNIVSNDYSYDEKWKEERKYYTREWNKYKDRKIQLRFKRDHK